MIKKIVDFINGIFKWILIVLFFVLVVVVFLQVIFRFVLEQPLAWTEELGRYLLVWTTFLGAGYGMSVKAHPGVEILYEAFGPTVKKVLNVVISILVIFFFWQVIVHSFDFIGRSMIQKSPVLQIPMGYIYTVIPISSILFIINLLYVVISEWNKEAKN
ncbi:TRAP transporter small permease [Fredinandcohnia sp. QZ13]|uniref:TRAP transporter small permease n=1 Tax=Bacillaceae TaxID=186817 RepID=UPI001CB98FC2|nr:MULTISPECIES: TRAP transporter small permease [Bacillaceae]MDR4887697.1 TRAP transporter small permease [Fredinandcohnia sp. QZ13]